MRLKKRGILISLRRDEGMEPKLEGPPVGRGRDICGFMPGYVKVKGAVEEAAVGRTGVAAEAENAL